MSSPDCSPSPSSPIPENKASNSASPSYNSYSADSSYLESAKRSPVAPDSPPFSKG